MPTYQMLLSIAKTPAFLIFMASLVGIIWVFGITPVALLGFGFGGFLGLIAFFWKIDIWSLTAGGLLVLAGLTLPQGSGTLTGFLAGVGLGFMAMVALYLWAK